MNLTVISQTELAVTLGWTPVPGCAGYVFYRDGVRVSNTWNPARSQVKFALDGQPHIFKVEAVAASDSGTVQIGGPTPAPPPPPSPGSGWQTFWGRQAAPVAITRPTVKVSTQSGLLQAIAATPGAELIQYTGGKDLTGEFTVTRNGPKSVVDLGGAKFTGAGYQLPNLFLQKAGGLRFVNGEIAGGKGDGLRIEDAMGQLEVWDFVVHDTAAQGIHLYGAKKACDGVVLHCEVYNCGLDLSQDPHPEPGTGLHGFYSGGSPYPVTNGDWTVWVHDQPHGAGMQINRTRNTRIATKGDNLTFVANSQVAGNPLQFWADKGEDSTTWNDRITVDYVEGNNVARVVETGGMALGSLASSKVVYGRGTGVRLSPAYATKAGMSYGDVKPLP